MLNNVATKLTTNDLPEILEIYKSKNSNLKVKITPTLDQYFRKGFEVACQGNLGHSAWGYRNEQGKLEMFATRSHWASMPYATLGNLFIAADNSFFGLSSKGLLVMNHFISDIFYDSAVNYQRYVGFMARDYRNAIVTVKTGRRFTGNDRNLMFKADFVEIIPPYNRAKYEFGSNILGILEGRNPEPVVIRSWTILPELIPELTKIKDHEFVIN